MDAREERGREIARKEKIVAVGPAWRVPSQSGSGFYLVDLSTGKCTCPDHELRGKRCKHFFAAQVCVSRTTAPDGTVTETRAVRVTYRQHWPAYNAAQEHEKERVAELLRALCAGIVQPPQVGRGRPRLPLADVTFSAVMKVYGTLSARRSTTDLREYENRGLVDVAPHWSSVFRALEDAKLEPILTALVEESAAPLRAVETDFAVDASGFSTNTYSRWFDHKWGRVRSEHRWIKCHIACGVKTNVVTSAVITDESGADSPQFEQLVDATAKRFPIVEVSADKAYLSNANLATVEKYGASVYIPFKSTSRGDTGSEVWRRMFHYFNFDRERFLAHYHKRSNVESTFSMVKRKFGGAVRSKLPTAQRNEVLCKLVAHNLACVVSAIYELGIEPMFWNTSAERLDA